jgi:8-oxo-dGTP pyrophosphatase MutT (NUDIX family)
MGKRIFQVLVIPFKKGQDGVKYAIFRRADLQVWQWIAGGGENGETPMNAAKREAWEETRIPVNSRIELAFFLTVFWAVLTRGKRAILTLF